MYISKRSNTFVTLLKWFSSFENDLLSRPVASAKKGFLWVRLAASSCRSRLARGSSAAGASLRAGSGHTDAGSSPGALVYPLGRLR